MSKVHDAEALARWLHSEPGTEPPPGLDPDVVEGILALRPDLAPPHRLTVEDVLRAVTEGPLASADAVQAAAQQLHAWLEAHPGQEPPAGLDPSVIEAAYALRPDLAPAPRVTSDDVMADITTGPLAPDAPAADAPISLDTERIQRTPWWARPAVGAVAVAATAILFVLPMAHMADIRPDTQEATVADSRSEAAPARRAKAKRAKRAKRAPKMAREAAPGVAKKVAQGTHPAPGVGQTGSRTLSASAGAVPEEGKADIYRKKLKKLEASAAVPEVAAAAPVDADAYLPPPPPPPAPAPAPAEPADDMPVQMAAAPAPEASRPSTSSNRSRRAPRGRSKDASEPVMGSASDVAEEAADTTEAETPATRTLEVRMSREGIASGVDLTCANGYRMRKTFKRNRTLFTQMPQSACTLHFRGGLDARRLLQPGEENLVCGLEGATLVCKAVSFRSR